MKSQRPPTRQPARKPARARALLDALEGRRLFAFGVTTGSTPTGQQTYVVDNGGDLKFAVIRGGTLSSTIHMGDLTSVQYKGKELLASYATTSRYSHYEQGLGSTAVVSYAIGGNNSWILVAADDSKNADGTVNPASATQYYAVRKGDNNLYLMSLPTDVNGVGSPGEGRFISYLDRNVFTTPEAASDNLDNTGAIEGGDVFGHADGTTSSKFFNNGRRMIDNVYHGLNGTSGTTAVGAYMFMGNREHSAGGPFFKDIDYQSSAGVTEMYNCIFTGHTQTESYRQGLHVYSMQMTAGVAPTTPDYSWLETVTDAGGTSLIKGLVPAAGRGAIAGAATGNPAGHDTVVGLANATEQYWARADANGNYSISGAMPGTYTMTLYDRELEVGTKTVTIAAGATTAANIVNAFYLPSNPVFRIGTFDGTPLGFLNADKIETEHPSDVRMSSWTSTQNFVVGTNTDSQFAMAQFMGVNNSQRITFTLSSAQVGNLTLRIGITWGFSGARPKVTANAGQTYAWTSANPSASSDLNSRGITRGTWRGDNQLYTFAIPSSAFRAGTNTLDIPLISGSYTAGQTWLSPNVSYDAIDLVPTTSASSPTIASVSVTPANASVAAGGSKAYAAIARGASGAPLAADIDWSAAAGTIGANGNYVAPSTTGTYAITALASMTRTPGYATSSTSTSAFGASVTGTGTTNVTVVTPAPAAPTNVVATAGNAQVALTWTAAPGATSYTIKRSTVSGGPYASLATGQASTSYTDATAANGTTYFYLVTAVNAGGSADSAQASATPAAPLAAAPVLTSFVVNDGSVQRSMVKSLTLTFNKAVSLGSAAVSLATQNGAAVSFAISPASGVSTQYVLSFPTGIGGSIGDGIYTLTVDGSGVTSAGSAQMTGLSNFTFHRLFGDADGDRDVDATDSRGFRAALDSTSAQSTYRSWFDFDGDGDVDATDSRAFRTRLDTVIS